MKIGMIGYGEFGRFFAHHLMRQFHVTVYDIKNYSRRAREVGLAWGTLAEVVSKDVIIIAVPLRALEALLKQLVVMIKPGVVVMDVCSVKKEPVRLMREHLTGVELLATHPVFGPESAKDGLQGHKMVFCPTSPKRSKVARLLFRFFRGQGVQIIEMEADAHDRDMVEVQVLTHYITRALRLMKIGKSDLATAAYKSLMRAVEYHSGDSWDLFRTIQEGNPYAGAERKKFRNALDTIEKRLASDKRRLAA